MGGLLSDYVLRLDGYVGPDLLGFWFRNKLISLFQIIDRYAVIGNFAHGIQFG